MPPATNQTMPAEQLFEVWVVPHDSELRREMDVRLSTFSTCPDKAVKKITRYLAERNHVCLKIPVDFVVHNRPFVE